jgi:hypothetical protein
VALRKWFLAVYAYIRFNTSIYQLEVETGVSFKPVYRRVQRFLRALDAPRVTLAGPVEIDEVYVSAGLKGRKRDREPRSRGLSKHGRGSCGEDKPPVFTLVDRGSDQRYAVPAKSADEPTVRLLLGNSESGSLTVYTD